MAHTLQLVIKIAYQKNYKGIIMKARHLVGQIRKSSVLVEKLVERSGKNASFRLLDKMEQHISNGEALA
jgi:hypothetical protein